MLFELRGRCPICKMIRVLHACEISTTDPALADLQEAAIPDVDANCPECGAIEEVATFANGVQEMPWTDAEKHEAENGSNVGPLPEKPWNRLRRN